MNIWQAPKSAELQLQLLRSNPIHCSTELACDLGGMHCDGNHCDLGGMHCDGNHCDLGDLGGTHCDGLGIALTPAQSNILHCVVLSRRCMALDDADIEYHMCPGKVEAEALPSEAEAISY